MYSDIAKITITSSKATLQVALICGFGYILRRKGLITKELHKGLSNLNIRFFTPCLLFTKMASNGTLETYKNMWPIVVIYFVLCILSYLVAFIGAKVLRLSKHMERFVTLSTLFSNSNSLPISLIQSIAFSSALEYLRRDPNDTSDMIEGRGIIYIMVFAAISNIVRWSYGLHLIHSIEEGSFKTVESFEGGYEAIPSEEAPLVEEEEVVVPPKKPITVKFIFQSVARVIFNVMNPPLAAILLAFCVSIIPSVKALLFGHSPLLSPLSHAVRVCSGAAIPSVLIGLGSNISMLIQDTSRRVSFRMVSLVVLSRFLIVPSAAISLLLYARPYFVLGNDPVFILMMMILISAPTAINLLMVCQSVNKFEDEMATVLLYSYILAIPVMTGLVTLFLYLIKIIYS